MGLCCSFGKILKSEITAFSHSQTLLETEPKTSSLLAEYSLFSSLTKRAQKPANPFILFPPHALITEVSYSRPPLLLLCNSKPGGFCPDLEGDQFGYYPQFIVYPFRWPTFFSLCSTLMMLQILELCVGKNLF